MADVTDPERNRFSNRLRRYAGVGAAAGGFAARAAGARLFRSGDRVTDADALKEALGGLKGPLMKAAQLLATIPEAVPEEYADAFMELQTNAPPMGRPFVRRRMRAELGEDWRSRFKDFELDAVAAASLGQVHRARAHDDRRLAVKLQYPDMSSAIEADLRQLDLAFGVFQRISNAIDPSEIKHELADRLREELDYGRERRIMALYRTMLTEVVDIATPEPAEELCTGRVLTMTWLDGDHISSLTEAPQEVRDAFAARLFKAWWTPFGRYGVIHGDPHMGNYAVNKDRATLNLLDFGCVRIFDGAFVEAVMQLSEAIERNDRDLAADAYRAWGFRDITNELVDALNIWAGFIYAPLMDDRERHVAEGVSPGAFGRAQAFEVHQALKRIGRVTPPRRFVFMDRAAIGLGSVFIRLNARLNFKRLFAEAVADFDRDAVDARRREAMADAGLTAAEAA